MKQLLDLEKEIKKRINNEKKTEQLYQLLSSYNALGLLFLNAKIEQERKSGINRNYDLISNCYEKQIESLFSLFKSNECLRLKLLSGINNKDILFLVDMETILRINFFNIMNSHISGLTNINYNLIKINNWVTKIYDESVYCKDPYYCDYDFENKKAIGLFYEGKMLTPGYLLNKNLNGYNNKNIKEILKVQPIDEIFEKITEAKNKKVKRLVLK